MHGSKLLTFNFPMTKKSTPLQGTINMPDDFFSLKLKSVSL